MQEGTLRKAPGEKGPDEKGRGSSPTIRSPAAKKKKKTIAQALQIVSPAPDLLSSFSDFASSQSDSPAPVPDDTSSSPQLDTFRPGSGPSQPQPDFVGLRVVHEPEEERDMNDFRAGFLERHCKRLCDPIEIVPSPAKRVCPEIAEEDPVAEVPPSIMSYPNEAGSTAAVATQLDVVGPHAAAATQTDVAGPSAAVVVQSDVAAFSNVLSTEETRGTNGGLDAVVDEEASDEKSNPIVAVPPSWEEIMEMLKGVSCFTDAEALSTKMTNFFPLTKRVSVNMGGDPPTFVKARLPFGTPESVVSCIQHLQEWTIPETVEVVILSVLFSHSFLAILIPSPGIIFCCCCST